MVGCGVGKIRRICTNGQPPHWMLDSLEYEVQARLNVKMGCSIGVDINSLTIQSIEGLWTAGMGPQNDLKLPLDSEQESGLTILRSPNAWNEPNGLLIYIGTDLGWDEMCEVIAELLFYFQPFI